VKRPSVPASFSAAIRFQGLDKQTRVSCKKSQGFCCQIGFVPYYSGAMDINYWGIICVPIGLILGFGPALLAAAFGSSKDVDVESRGKKRD
jgi:hypothetical protein